MATSEFQPTFQTARLLGLTGTDQTATDLDPPLMTAFAFCSGTASGSPRLKTATKRVTFRMVLETLGNRFLVEIFNQKPNTPKTFTFYYYFLVKRFAKKF